MIALQQNLVAAANAHQLMAKLAKSRGGISCAEQKKDCSAQQNDV
jgi:hypothetical protein